MGPESGQLMSIGAVSAHNIAQSLGLDDSTIPAIERAIKDEISVMSSHFTSAVADMRDAHEVELNKAHEQYANQIAQAHAELRTEVARIKSTFSWVRANRPIVVAALGFAFAVGVLVGSFL